MPGGISLRSLSQFHELTPEDVVQAQLLRDFTRDINTVRAVRIDVSFLKKQDVSIHLRQELYNGGQFQATINVPVDNSNGTGRPGKTLVRREILSNDLLRRHIKTLSRQVVGRRFAARKSGTADHQSPPMATPLCLWTRPETP